MDKQNALYSNVVTATNNYLGPAAGRFINRQIRNHLQISPDQLTSSDLVELIEWLQIAMACLTNDNKLVKEYVGTLRVLAKDTPEKA